VTNPATSEDQLKRKLVTNSQQGLKSRPKQGLLVSSALVPAELAAQTLIG
jgi:hypothetical protein